MQDETGSRGKRWSPCEPDVGSTELQGICESLVHKAESDKCSTSTKARL